jgi:2-deoxy-D-gluconate 3-dehydrogenase
MADLTPFSLEGHVALVTGGATGIGRAVATGLARAGADVAITTNRHAATETRQAVEALEQRFMAQPLDLNTLTEATVNAFLDRVETDLGPFDIVVNNAGIIRRAPAAEHALEDWRAVMNVNLDAVWLLSRAAGRRMLPRGQGKIVNIASLLSFQGGINVPGYAAAKHAVAGLTKALANEWAKDGIQVNAIAPGYIATDNTEALRNDEIRNRQILERIPAGRWGTPEDIAGTAVFLSSPAADYISGQVLVVDGGWLSR